jgi:hypothetical protein
MSNLKTGSTVIATSTVSPTSPPVGSGTTTNQVSYSPGMLFRSDRFQRALYIAVADLFRQTLGSGDVKLYKAGVVGGASLVSQWLLAAPIDSIVNSVFNSDNATFDYILNILAETVGVTAALVALSMTGIAKSSDIASTDGEPNLLGKGKKQGKIMKAFMLALTDIVIAEVGRYATQYMPMGSSTTKK